MDESWPFLLAFFHFTVDCCGCLFGHFHIVVLGTAANRELTTDADMGDHPCEKTAKFFFMHQKLTFDLHNIAT